MLYFFKELPIWWAGHIESSDGSISEWFLHPARIYKDPFRRGNHILVWCETYTSEGKPTFNNTRNECVKISEKCASEEPWFGIEQEYTFLDVDNHPLGWPKNGYPDASILGYCGVGANKTYGRDVVEAHTRACLYAGIKLGGINAEGHPSQWEFQVGPSSGTSIGDDLWMARFLLHRIAEEFGVRCVF